MIKKQILIDFELYEEEIEASYKEGMNAGIGDGIIIVSNVLEDDEECFQSLANELEEDAFETLKELRERYLFLSKFYKDNLRKIVNPEEKFFGEYL
jgi:hypothetical protein